MNSNKRRGNGEEEDNSKKQKSSSEGSVAKPPALIDRDQIDILPPPPFHFMLHRHALESIFGFLSLGELHIVLQVTSHWSAPITTMAHIQSTWHANSNNRAMVQETSRLQRHVTVMHGATLQFYANIYHRLINLRYVQLGLFDVIVFPGFPIHLQELRLFEWSPDEQRTNRLMSLAAQLTQLKFFSLQLIDNDRPNASIDFRLLHPAPKLSHFTVQLPDGHATDQQVIDLRELPHQEILPCMDRQLVHETVALRLLKPPHHLQWNSLGSQRIRMTQHWHEAITNLPSLTQLTVEFGRDYEFFASRCDVPLCLASLVNLKDLQLHDRIIPNSNNERYGLDAFNLFNALKNLHALTRLALHECSLNTQDLAALMLHLPSLVDLKLLHCRRIVSLNFLVAPINTRPFCSLTHLTIQGCPIQNEPQYLHGLTNVCEVSIQLLQLCDFQPSAWMALTPMILFQLTKLDLTIGESPPTRIHFGAVK